MDYVEAFQNLKTNNKYSRKSPHKAVLLLAIIDMFESCTLTDNVIKYDDVLKSAFVKTWNKVLPNEATFHSEAYLPFWFMQSEGFWHIVPLRGKEDILSILRDSHVKPSESKLSDCVNYAELDEDLYFLMTLQSGRSSLKRVLLETYSTLSTRMIDRLSESYDNFTDSSEEALNEYENIISSTDTKKTTTARKIDNELEVRFSKLKEDIQYVLNIEYFTFLKKNINEREMFKDVCPTVYDLYDKIAFNPIRQGEISPSISFAYENFLADLKITLMSEDGAFELVDKINEAIGCLSLLEINQKESSFEVEDTEEVVAVDKKQKGVEKADKPTDFYVENTSTRGIIFNVFGEQVYSVPGQLKVFHGKLYRFNYKEMCFTVKDLIRKDNEWEKGAKKIVSYDSSDLYPQLNKTEFINQIEDLVEGTFWQENQIRVCGKWYDFKGYFIKDATPNELVESDSNVDLSPTTETFDFEPKGQLKWIDEVAHNSFDYLWLIAIVDFMGSKLQESRLNFDNIACRMIANAWEILNENPVIKEYEPEITECIEFLIEESSDYMDIELSWSSTRDVIYESIKDYPMAGVFEETVEVLLENAPISVLALWIVTDYDHFLIAQSQEFHNSCLYALHPRKIDPFIEINPKWTRYLNFESSNLFKYYKQHYIDYISKTI